MADEDRAVLERLAALEAEVKSEADAQRARKEAALTRLREQRVTQAAERDSLRAKPVSKRKSAPEPAADEPGESLRDRIVRRATGRTGLEDLDGRSGDDHLENLGGAIELASKANRVKQELTKPAKKGDKSWVVAGVASFALGPAGWLYAGSMREAVPATAGYLALLALAAKILPTLFILPIFGIALPLSAIAGIVYALQYNRTGKRQRLFDGDKKATKLLRGD